eukprot:g2003.t1
MSASIEQRNREATCYVGNLDERVTEALLWELFLQVGPVVNCNIPTDKVTGRSQGFGFVEFRSVTDAEYACRVLRMVVVFGRPLKVRASGDGGSSKSSNAFEPADVGANLFVGNLSHDTDENTLFEAFCNFGKIVKVPNIPKDEDTGLSKGFGFVTFESFEGSDLAIEKMDGQMLNNQRVTVQYALKKGGARGERHGSHAERLLAAAKNASTIANAANPAMALNNENQHSLASTFVEHTMFAENPNGPVVNQYGRPYPNLEINKNHLASLNSSTNNNAKTGGGGQGGDPLSQESGALGKKKTSAAHTSKFIINPNTSMFTSMQSQPSSAPPPPPPPQPPVMAMGQLPMGQVPMNQMPMPMTGGINTMPMTGGINQVQMPMTGMPMPMPPHFGGSLPMPMNIPNGMFVPPPPPPGMMQQAPNPPPPGMMQQPPGFVPQGLPP